MTSKEQAEELARECETVYVKYPEINMAQAVMLAVPLTELLEVAKAASGLAMGSDWNNGTHAKHHGYRDKLNNALVALRATGKVKL